MWLTISRVPASVFFCCCFFSVSATLMIETQLLSPQTPSYGHTKAKMKYKWMLCIFSKLSNFQHRKSNHVDSTWTHLCHTHQLHKMTHHRCTHSIGWKERESGEQKTEETKEIETVQGVSAGRCGSLTWWKGFALNGAGCAGMRGGVAAAGTGHLKQGRLGGRHGGGVWFRARLCALFRTSIWRERSHVEVRSLHHCIIKTMHFLKLTYFLLFFASFPPPPKKNKTLI